MDPQNDAVRGNVFLRLHAAKDLQGRPVLGPDCKLYALQRLGGLETEGSQCVRGGGGVVPAIDQRIDCLR